MNDVWQHNGKHYGYPQCCIDYFCSGWQEERLNRPLILTVTGFIKRRCKLRTPGFIPCPKHCQMFNEEGLEALKREVPKLYERYYI